MSDKRQLLRALDLLQDLALNVVQPTTLRVKSPPPGSRTPWLLAGWFEFPAVDVTYDDILLILRQWDSRATRAAIGSQRLSRIQVRYTTSRGKGGEYTLAEIGPWTSTISRAVERVGLRDESHGQDREALVVRYGLEGDTSEIDALVVWLSPQEWSSRWQRVTGLPERPKPRVKAKPKAKTKPKAKPRAKAKAKTKARSKRK